MKKFKLFPLVTFVLLLGSCKKDNAIVDVQMPETSILNKSAAEQVKYAEVNLKKIASGFAKLAKNPEFVNFVHHEASRKFDGEYETLIEHLKRNATWGPLLNTNEINEGLAAFKNLNGNNFYPQIYIPKMQHDEENQILNFTSNNSSNTLDDLKVVIHGGEAASTTTTNEEYPGYEIDDDGELIEWNDIGEAYADSNLVWIFSLNELIDAQGRLSLPTNPACTDPLDPECSMGGGGGGGTSTTNDTDPMEFSRNPHPDMNTHTPVNFRISKMTVQEHKERWVSGGSEICIRAVLNTINGRSLGNLNSPTEQYTSTTIGKTSYLGRFIRKFTRSEINGSAHVNMSFPLQTGWPTSSPLSDPIYFDYVIFERDNWPAEKNYLYRQDYDGAPFYIQDTYSQFYRSEQDAYLSGTLRSVLTMPTIGGLSGDRGSRYYTEGGSATYLSLYFESQGY